MTALTDRYGYALTTASPAARDAYVNACDRLLAADAGTEAVFQAAIAADEGFALAHIGLARILQIVGRGGEAKAPLERALALAEGTTPRERSHIEIFRKILTGQGTAAIPMIAAHVQEWPRDAMALAPATSVFGLLAFSGRAGREVDLLALLEPLAPAYGDDWWFRTVLGFARIELQQHDTGLADIETALRGNPRSANAAHIRSHLYYEMGERAAGLAFLSEWARDYPREGQLHCHVSWHLALWYMETGQLEKAWEVYDTSLRPGAAWGPQINVLTDCVAFLARAEMAGVPVAAERWQEIARYGAEWFPGTGVTFADMHSAFAFARAGDTEHLQRIVEHPKGPAADILGPIAQGFAAYAKGEWAGAVDAIAPVLPVHERVGGSRAQRDLLEYTVASALVHDGRREEARRMIAARRPQNGRAGFPLAGL